MGIRGKLLLPLVLLGASVGAILHLYWLPEFRASQTENLKTQELAHLEVLAAGLIAPLLASDLAQIHATMDRLLETQRSWQQLYLRSTDDRLLYPLAALGDAHADAGTEWLVHPIRFDGKTLASIELQIDIDRMLENQFRYIKRLEEFMLLLLIAITVLAALLQDRWIRQPLKALVTASSAIQQGDFNMSLPKSSSDEVGTLISTFGNMRHDLFQREEALALQHKLLNIISTAQSRYIRDANAKSLFDRLLSDILELTGSEYGFIGEVLYRDDVAYLKTLAITNIAWNDETRKFYAENAPQGLEFTNLNTLFGAALTGGAAVISNDPDHDPRAGGRPEGHPPLTAFLGVPFSRGDKVVGMFGLANRQQGYDQSLVDFLQPVTHTCTQIVEALKADRHRTVAEAKLLERETRMRTIFENVVDAIITTNDHGVIESFNHAAETLFGYRAEEVTGKNVNMLIPAAQREQHDRFIDSYLHGAHSEIIGTGREVTGLRKDGSRIPIDIAITEMWIDNERLFCSIMRDITERKKIDRMKDEFVSTVSHELRTPLTSIRGSLGLLIGGVTGSLPEQAVQLLDIACKNAERLLLLINDILDIEKIESGKMTFSFQDLPLTAFLEQAIKANDAYAAQQNVRLLLKNGGGDNQVYADPDRLMQVMSNLLSNAVKFSPDGAEVEVTQSLVNGRVRISVTDHGCGIPAEFHAKLFDKFTQSDASNTRKIGGTGLGLNIARAVVQKHGGRIDFKTREGKGTTFFFELPAVQATPDTSA